MAKPLVDDELWKLIQPLLPVPMPRRWRYPGRKRLQNRRALTGILFVLKSGILWEMLPQEMGCGSGMTCWRRLRDWQEVGVGKTVMKCFWPNCEKPTRLTGLEPWWIAPPYGRLAEGGKLGPISLTGASRSKHHLITDAQGIPLAAILMGANRHDVTQLLPLVKAIPSIRGQVGRPRRRPDQVQGDRAYDSEPHRQALRSVGIEPVLAKRLTQHGSGLGIHRWVVERTLAWLHQFRRLRTRYERRADIHEAFLSFGCSLICLTRSKSIC